MTCYGCARPTHSDELVPVWTNKLWCHDCAHGIEDLRRERISLHLEEDERPRRKDQYFDRQEFFHYLRTWVWEDFPHYRNDVRRFLHYHRAWKEGRDADPFYSPMCEDITGSFFFDPVNG